MCLQFYDADRARTCVLVYCRLHEDAVLHYSKIRSLYDSLEIRASVSCLLQTCTLMPVCLCEMNLHFLALRVYFVSWIRQISWHFLLPFDKRPENGLHLVFYHIKYCKTYMNICSFSYCDIFYFIVEAFDIWKMVFDESKNQ